MMASFSVCPVGIRPSVSTVNEITTGMLGGLRSARDANRLIDVVDRECADEVSLARGKDADLLGVIILRLFPRS